MEGLKTKKIFIPDIKRKIERKLKELQLKPEISPKKFFEIHQQGKHRYFSPCQTKENDLVAFYARLHNNLDAKEKFIQEICFLNEIKRKEIKIKNLIPPILNWGIEKDFEWFIRKYPLALPPGTIRSITTQLPFFEIIGKLTDAIFEISKIRPQRLNLKLKKFNHQNYLSLSCYEGLVKKKIITKELAEKVLKMLKKNLFLAEKENHYFSHGDLNLGNILAEQNRIWLIDWELIHLNNFAYDIGYLWAHLWEAKSSFRRKLLDSYLKKLEANRLAKFKRLLPIVVSYLSLGGIEYKKRKEKLKILGKRRDFYLHLLENCTKDFQSLIKT